MGFVFARMVNWRSFFVKFKNHWENLRLLVQPYLDCDYDQCLDLIVIGAGVRPLPGPEPWKRKCLVMYRLLGFYQFLMGIAKVGFSIRKGNDTLEICASISFLVAQIAIYAKVFVLGHYDEVIRQVKTFVNSGWCYSRDPEYDSKVRRDNAGMPGKVTLAVFLVLCWDQVNLFIPSSARDRTFGIPEQFNALGVMIARLMQEAYVFMLAIFFGCGYALGPLTIMPLLTGIKHELMIVARGYETVAALGDQNNANALVLTNLKRKFAITVEQHAEALRIIHLVQPLVSYLYAIIYYSVMIIVSLLVFVVIRSKMTLVTLAVIGIAGIAFVLECYVWCRMIDSIEETMAMIGDNAASLNFEMQHSVDNHTEYVEMRTSTMIVQLNASQCHWFSCGGIYPISVESFGNLCMIIYKFATFLLNID